jgi:hypothetical protein
VSDDEDRLLRSQEAVSARGEVLTALMLGGFAGDAGRIRAVVMPTVYRILADARAWRDNYDGIYARWSECDTERLALKDQLAHAELRLRLATHPAPTSTTPEEA